MKIKHPDIIRAKKEDNGSKVEIPEESEDAEKESF
jgi:hypothetical protein